MAEEHTIGLRVKQFERRYSRDGSKSTDWVELYNITGMDETGTVRASTWHRIKDLDPREEYMERENMTDERAVAINSRWADISPNYQAWLNDQEMPETGTPLAAWAGITVPQGAALQAAGYRTVEDVAAMPENIIDKIPLPDTRAIILAAKSWLDSLGSTQQAEEMAKMRAELDAMKAEREETLALLEEAAAAPAPKRRGRPPKDLTEEVAA